MSQETAFLEAIQAAPRDMVTRLVYADWLEERGDPRAELIRIEEEMRPLSVFSDRFWELKPRRYELLQKLPKDWLETMCYGIDCPPTFAHVPNGWKEWWRVIRVFVERWHGYPNLPDVGGRKKEIESTEKSLKRKLPPSIQEWVAFAHDIRADPNSDLLVDSLSFRMEEMKAQSATSFLAENSDSFRWAIQHDKMAADDPPVFGYYLEKPGQFALDTSYGNPESETMTAFVLNYFLMQCPGHFRLREVVVSGQIELLDRLITDFPIHLAFGPIDIFEWKNLLIQYCRYPDTEERLQLHFFRPIPKEELPRPLWDFL